MYDSKSRVLDGRLMEVLCAREHNTGRQRS